MIEVVVNGEKIKVLTHHGFPFRRFNSTPEANPKVFKEFDSIIKKLEPTVVTGDFNAERFYEMMDYTRENYQKGFDEVTTVDNMKFDNILTLNEKSMINQKTRKTLSDHFMLIADIKLK
jgi:endonuclease/exonuclease/phosphatase family metal-dependent hydrolase